jgi:hypothetical protein
LCLDPAPPCRPVAERLNQASAKAYETNLLSIQANANAVRPVVTEGFMKLFPSPSPPPPPFTTSQFGINFWDAATSADFDTAAKVLGGGAEETVNFGMHELDSVEGEHETEAKVTSAGMHLLLDRAPPPPSAPSAAAALKLSDAASKAAHQANVELMLASAAAMGASTDLMNARVQEAMGGAQQAVIGGEKAFPYRDAIPTSAAPPLPPPPPPPAPPASDSSPFYLPWWLRADPPAKNRTSANGLPPHLWVVVTGCAMGAAVGGAVAGGMLAVRRFKKQARAGVGVGPAKAAAVAMI